MAQDRPEIVSILSILTEHEVTLLRLKYRERLTWRQVGLTLGCKALTARVAAYRAIAKLRECRAVDLTVEF